MNDWETKRFEAETLAYKQFMKVAKKVCNLQYGKWRIVPSVEDPLRKFTLEKDFEWATVKYQLKMEQVRKRTGDWNNRIQYRADLIIYGLYASSDRRNNVLYPNYSHTILKLKPRMAKKLIKETDEQIIPSFYKMVDYEKINKEINIKQNNLFKQQLAKVPSMITSQDKYGSSITGNINNCPFTIYCFNDKVELSGNMTYDNLKEMVERMGWGK